MHDNVAIIREFIGAWSNLDAGELVNFFTEDGVYHNMPSAPVAGKTQLLPYIQGFLGNWTSTVWEIRTIIGSGNLVIAERLDRTVVGAIKIDLPCCGIFEMEAGKIKVWRDYFDLGTYMKPFQKKS